MGARQEKNQIQAGVLGAQLLQKVLPGFTKADLANALHGSESDFEGMVVVNPDPDLSQFHSNQVDRLLGMTGMSANGESPIGFAQIVKDLGPFAQQCIAFLRGRSR